VCATTTEAQQSRVRRVAHVVRVIVADDRTRSHSTPLASSLHRSDDDENKAALRDSLSPHHSAGAMPIAYSPMLGGFLLSLR
jgi:hypothetical protein